MIKIGVELSALTSHKYQVLFLPFYLHFIQTASKQNKHTKFEQIEQQTFFTNYKDFILFYSIVLLVKHENLYAFKL